MRQSIWLRGNGRALGATLLVAFCPHAFALNPALDVSQYSHTVWKLRDGFTKAPINSISQTPDGYLWMGTQFGVLRFDGARNVPWQPPKGHLPSTQIMSLLVTRDGTLWIGTLQGLVSWKDGKLTEYPELATFGIFKLLEDHEGKVWASGMSINLGRLCAIQKGSAKCHGDDGVLGRGALSLYQDRMGNLWAGVVTGVWRWKPGAPNFYPLPGETDGIQGLGEDDDGALLVGWHGGIHRLVEGKTKVYPLQDTERQFRARRILRDRDGGLWVGTQDRGLVHVHHGRTELFGPSDGLSGENVYALFEDREGDIWVATGTGLDRFRDVTIPTFTDKEGLTTAVTSAVLAARDGSVWLSTRGGLNRWRNGQFAMFGTSGKLNGLNPNSLYQDADGRIWISTTGGVGYLENDRFVSVSAVPGSVTAIAQDTSGSLWIANDRAALLQLVHQIVVHQIPWSTFGANGHASAMAADPLNGGLWLGFHLGGVAYFKDNQVRAAYAPAQGLGTGRVNYLKVDPGGALWAATEGGLSRLKNGRVANLTTKDGLPCDTVHWVMDDDADSVWLYTACGILRITRSELESWAAAVDRGNDATATLHPTVFDSSDGVRSLASIGYYIPQVAKSFDGKIWFLPWDGVSVIDPRHIPVNKLPPPVHIEQITADRKVHWENLPGAAASNLRLPALSRDLQIDYTALSLVAPEKIRFRVKLEGRDTNWKDAGNERKAFYTDLPPHQYRFRVIASNNSGVWNETGDTLEFSIAPAYYQTNLFRAGCVAALLALTWGLYRYRLHQIAKEFNARLDGRVDERLRVARDLHDTLLQSFQGLLLRFQAAVNLLPGRGADARQVLVTAIDDAARAITEARDAVQGMRSSTVLTNELAKAIEVFGKELAEQQRAANENPTAFSVEVEGTSQELHPILRDEVYRITGEALRNAFRHARARRIEVEIRYDARALRVRVRDDGIGMDASVLQEGRTGHYGLPGMRERAKDIGGQLEVWSEQGAGTEVELTIPASGSSG